MNPGDKEKAILLKDLSTLHGKRFEGLTGEAQGFANFLRGLSDFKLVASDLLLEIPHVGRVIVDAVLQIGHDYEKQVRQRVERIIGYSQAAGVSGFMDLLHEQGIIKVLNWYSKPTENNLLLVARHFASQGIETYAELQQWLESEEHRDGLLGLKGEATFKVADKTADYFRVLVSRWDAVAVDTNIRAILESAEISSRYNYKEKRTIVQLAALQMGLRPIDLDASIYNDSLVHPERYKRKEGKPKRPRDRGTCQGSGGAKANSSMTRKGEAMNTEGRMPKKGDVFEGKINDLCLWDASGWRRRDIWFFKGEVKSRQKYGYPSRQDRIVLIDTDGDRYELNFSKPDLDDKVCLGTPAKLKPWYQKKGFDPQSVHSGDKLYFEYSGQGIEFFVLTESEYRGKQCL